MHSPSMPPRHFVSPSCHIHLHLYRYFYLTSMYIYSSIYPSCPSSLSLFPSLHPPNNLPLIPPQRPHKHVPSHAHNNHPLSRNSGSAQHWLREGIDRGADVLRKAVVPIAGLGTRMFPMSALVPKAFLPIVSLPAQGGVATPPLIRPFLHTVIRQGPSLPSSLPPSLPPSLLP